MMRRTIPSCLAGVALAAALPATAEVLTTNEHTEILYHFDEGSGTDVADSSSHGRDATLSATLAADPMPWVPGDTGHGNAIHQDGPADPSDYRAVNWSDFGNSLDLSSMSAFTVHMRFRATQWTDQDSFWTLGDGAGIITLTAPTTIPPVTSIDELLIVYTAPFATQSVNTATIALSTTLVAATWYDLAVVYRDNAVSNPLNDNLQIWLDGELIGSAPTAGDIGDSIPTTSLAVGHQPEIPGATWFRSFEGDYDEFRFQSEAVFGIEEPPATPLTADANTRVLYHFDEGIGTNVMDASSNNRTGTFSSTLAADGSSAWIEGQVGLSNAVFFAEPDVTEKRWVTHTGTDMGLLAAEAFTVQMRVNPALFTDTDTLFSFGIGAGDFNILAWTNVAPVLSIPALNVDLRNGALNRIEVPLNPPLVVSQWQELAVVVRDDSATNALNDNIQVWIDGALAGSMSTTSDVDTLNSSTFTIGHGPVDPFWPKQYQGGIDEFRVQADAVYAVVPEASAKIVGLDVTPPDAVITWESTSNGTYQVDRSMDLIQGFTEILATNVPATPPLNTYTDTVTGVDDAAYRIQEE